MHVRNIRHRVALSLGALAIAACCTPASAFDRFESGLNYMQSGGERSQRTAASQQRAQQESSFDADVDFQKMAIITEDALSRGHKIVWIHPPQKRPGRSDSERAKRDR